MLRRWMAGALMTTLIGSVLVALTPATAHAGPYQCDRSESHTPHSGVRASHRNWRLENLLLRNVCHTPRGAYIRVATWTFTSEELADALVAAYRRGVVVRVLMPRGRMRNPDNGDRYYAAVRTLRDNLGTGGTSWIKGVRNSARGTDRFDGKWTTFHQKSWTFSTTGTRRRVSVVLSVNPTQNARTSQHGDAVQLVERWDVYNKIRDVFVQQTRDEALSNPYIHWRNDGVRLYFNPWDSPGMADPVVRRINGIPDHAHLRIANSAWYGARGNRIARAVARHERATGGKDVWVLASKPFGDEVRDILCGAGVTVYDGYYHDGNYQHMKSMSARWRGSDGNAKTRVWIGSENWSANARGTDELTIRVKGFGMHQTYVKHFDRAADKTAPWKAGPKVICAP